MLKQLDSLIGFAVVMAVVSLLIMVVTQAISSLIALRGRNLRDALEAMFARIVPSLQAQGEAQALAELVLMHPSLSDSMLSMKSSWFASWKLGTGITADECLAALKQIALNNGDFAASIKVADSTLAREKSAAVQILTKLSADDAKGTADALRKLILALPAPATAQQYLNDLVTHASATATNELQRWNSLFESVQDRAQQWFTVRTRRVTVVLSFVAAFALQLDAFELFSRISHDTQLRTQLVGLSQTVQQRADTVLNKELPGNLTFAALKRLQTTVPETSALGIPPTTISTSDQAREWIESSAKSQKVPEDKTRKFLTFFDSSVQDEAQARLSAAEGEVGKLASIYGEPSLGLLPDPYPSSFGRWFDATFSVRHFFGMVAASFLLTLGAPFWFNALKNLSSLRSSVADPKDQSSPPVKK